MKHDPSKYFIMLGFISLLALCSIIAFVSLFQMDRTLNNMSDLVTVTNAKITHANEMRDFLRMRGDTLIQISQTENVAERENLRLAMEKYSRGYKNAHDNFNSYAMGGIGRKLFNEATHLEAISSELNNQAVALMLAPKIPRNVIKDAIKDANRARAKTIDELSRLVVRQEDNARQALKESVAYQKLAQVIIIILTLASLLVGGLISLFVLRETTRKNSEMRFQASHDELTKLINRKEFETRLESALKKAHSNGGAHALCFLDLDQFKVINDTCGHKAGDELLCQLTRVINSHVRDRDTLSRLGGDEFGLLLENCNLETAIDIAEGIIRLVNKYEFNWQGKIHHVGVSIGITAITRNTDNITKAMSEADIACYAAKDMGRNQLYVHELSDAQVKRMHKELRWVADIRNSLKDNRFKLYSQPIYTTLGALPEIRMQEVLLRLKDDEGNISSPGNYILAAERFGLMRDVDQWVIEQVIQTLHEIGDTRDICLFVNLSTNSLSDKNFCAYILKLLADYEIDGNSICFEITETAAIRNLAQVAGFIKALKQAHCLFALDDFGSSTTSFSYLQDLPVDYLKIDGALVTDIHSNNISHAMVAAINEIGSVMNIKTIAEHVENELTLKRLDEIGIDFAQGFHFGSPKPIDTLARFKRPEIVRETPAVYLAQK
jgi:diguanylate cyclase (GGDEF)-like protein